MYRENSGLTSENPVVADLAVEISRSRERYTPSRVDMPGVQAHLILVDQEAAAGQNSRDAIHSRVTDPSSIGWGQYQEMAYAELMSYGEDEVTTSRDVWIDQMGQYLDSQDQAQTEAVLSALGIDKSQPDAMERLLDYQGDLEGFVKRLAKVDDFEGNASLIDNIAGSLYGRDVSLEMAMQLTRLMHKVEMAGGNEEQLGTLADSLAEALDSVDESSPQGRAISAIKNLAARAREVGRRARTEATLDDPGLADDPRAALEEITSPEGFPANSGAFVAAMRAGQDRVEYISQNGLQIYSANDGAGTEGGKVADTVTKRIAEELRDVSADDITPDILKRVAQKVHGDVRRQYDVGPTASISTIDTLCVLPNGEKLILHVGEGSAGRFRTADDLREGGRSDSSTGQSGRLIEQLVQPHQLGRHPNGDPIRTPKGIKALGIGVDYDITPDVVSVDKDDVVILGSDGFFDILPFLSIETPVVHRFLRDKNYAGLSRYLGERAKEFATGQYGTGADDISIVIVG